MHIEEKVEKQLFAMQDIKYRDFVSKLIPNISYDTIIGIRTPEMRKFAKEFVKEADAESFIKILPHRYYEENNLHGAIIESMKDYERVISELEIFLPYVDNWATCDTISPKIFKKHLPELLTMIKQWLKSDHAYTIRFGMEMLMTFYLDEHFKPEYLKLVADVKSQEYYVNMMIAWFFATALAKQYESTLPFIEQNTLDKWTHNKTIQKAVESFRVSDERKTYLKTLKIK